MRAISGTPRRRRMLGALGAGVWLSAGLAPRTQAAAPNLLPLSLSLADELARALAVKQPLVVMVSLAGCPFCKVVREHYLGPMHQREGLPVVQVDMRSSAATADFARQATTHDELVRAWGVGIAPTVLFFGKGGSEVAERLEGGYIPDFYGAYLDDRLTVARRRI